VVFLHWRRIVDSQLALLEIVESPICEGYPRRIHSRFPVPIQRATSRERLQAQSFVFISIISAFAKEGNQKFRTAIESHILILSGVYVFCILFHVFQSRSTRMLQCSAFLNFSSLADLMSSLSRISCYWKTKYQAKLEKYRHILLTKQELVF